MHSPSQASTQTFTYTAKPLSTLSVPELEKLFVSSSCRFEQKLKEGREPLTRYFETRIVSELQRRRPASHAEKTRIDNYIKANKAEIDNLCAITRLPLGKCDIDISHHIAPKEMMSLIDSLKDYETVSEREMLIEIVDKAIDYIAAHRDTPLSPDLAARLIELKKRGSAMCPDWIEQYLLETIRKWQKTPPASETHMVIPLLTASAYYNDRKSGRKAVRILNRLYRSIILSDKPSGARALTDAASNVKLSENPSLPDNPIAGTALPEDDFIAGLYLVEQCKEFVTHYSPRKMSAARTRHHPSAKLQPT